MKLRLAMVWLALAACSNGKSGTDDTDAVDTDSSDTDVSDTDPGAATFTQVDAIFQNSCASFGCHATAEATTGLDLSSANAYANLVNVPSHGVPSMDRVEPGDAVNSYLIHKVDGTFVAVGGSDLTDSMPPPFGLSADDIATITSWVNGGALP